MTYPSSAVDFSRAPALPQALEAAADAPAQMRDATRASEAL
jgi:hypothetical protein